MKIPQHWKRFGISAAGRSGKDSPRSPLLIAVLDGLSLLYGEIVRCRNILYDRNALRPVKIPRPVVSVGNITAGGTGKTPMVIHLARFFRDRGYRPVVLSRGYGGRDNKKRANVVSDGKSVLLDPAKAGDEPFLMARVLKDVPVVTGARRVEAGYEALRRFRPDLFLLDDGFQHRKIHRDLDILLMDEESPFGNGHLLPRGVLREPVQGLSRADMIVLTGSSGTGGKVSGAIDPRIPRGKPLFRAARKPEALIRGKENHACPPEYLRGKELIAFSGIGNPPSFHRLLSGISGAPLTGFSFPDHHGYTREDVDRIRREAFRIPGALMVTTEKDGVKLEQFPDFFEQIYRLRISMTLGTTNQAFESLLLEVLES